MNGFHHVKPENIVQTEKGRREFKENQSLGKHKFNLRDKPEYLDDYFFVLRDGHRILGMMSREYQQMFVKGKFWGLYQLWLDWKGQRHLLKELLRWYPKETGQELPEWINKERTDDEEAN